MIENDLVDANLIGDVVGGTVSLVSILFALYKYIEVKDSKRQIEPVIILKKESIKKMIDIVFLIQYRNFQLKCVLAILRKKLLY